MNQINSNKYLVGKKKSGKGMFGRADKLLQQERSEEKANLIKKDLTTNLNLLYLGL